MTEFIEGQMVVLKSDKSIKGALIAVMECGAENRCHVFTNKMAIFL